MNILVLNYEFPPLGGGGATVSYNVSKGLASLGHNVSVVTMKYKDLPAYEEIEGIQIHRVRCLRSKQFVCHPWEQLSYIISAVSFLKKFLRKSRVDAVHAHFIIPTGVVARYLKKKYKLSYTLIAHGSDVPGHNNKRFGALYKLIFRPWKRIVSDADCVISLSEYLKALICQNMGAGYNPNSIQVIHNGIDAKQYRPLPKKKRILLMGRIQETKGMQNVLECLSPEFLGEWRVDVAGNGPYMENLREIVRKNKLEEYVTFHGWVQAGSDKQLKLLSEASIYVSGSYFENSPITPLEAYCSGCSVVLSDIPAHRECMGEEAIFFSLNDCDGMTDAIRKGMESYREIVDVKDSLKYDWSGVIQRYNKLLKARN